MPSLIAGKVPFGGSTDTQLALKGGRLVNRVTDAGADRFQTGNAGPKLVVLRGVVNDEGFSPLGCQGPADILHDLGHYRAFKRVVEIENRRFSRNREIDHIHAAHVNFGTALAGPSIATQVLARHFCQFRRELHTNNSGKRILRSEQERPTFARTEIDKGKS